MDPRSLKKWLILIAVLYLVFPRDLIPDFLGRGLGLIDDLSLVALLTYFYRKLLQKHAARETGERAGDDRGARSRPAQAAPESASDPYAVLGVASSASRDAIQAAYKARMKEYHPDKVAHLGEELQQLAHRKALEIQEAYRQLRR
ncbi:MAG: DnaJ domain-containing protein [Myxococcales bacterium]|nr:DnaJ domain-containing protein [Myxococcales bacterium]